MNVGAPVDEGVEAVRPVPVVVARCEVDRDRADAGERLAQKLCCVPPGALMFVEVPAAEECVRLVRTGSMPQSVPGCLAALGDAVARRPPRHRPTRTWSRGGGPKSELSSLRRSRGHRAEKPQPPCLQLMVESVQMQDIISHHTLA